jgi:hypothetical protein
MNINKMNGLNAYSNKLKNEKRNSAKHLQYILLFTGKKRIFFRWMMKLFRYGEMIALYLAE